MTICHSGQNNVITKGTPRNVPAEFNVSAKTNLTNALTARQAAARPSHQAGDRKSWKSHLYSFRHSRNSWLPRFSLWVLSWSPFPLPALSSSVSRHLLQQPFHSWDGHHHLPLFSGLKGCFSFWNSWFVTTFQDGLTSQQGSKARAFVHNWEVHHSQG